MRMRLAIRALIKYLAGLILVGILLFVPAGSFRYFEAWLFIGLLFVPMLLLGIVLLFRSPELLQKRLESKEEEKTQKGVLGVFAFLFVAGFILAGLDYRFDWSRFPPIIPKIGSVFLLVCYALYAEVIRENAYLSRTIHVQEGQLVIDTGLYAFVRDSYSQRGKGSLKGFAGVCFLSGKSEISLDPLYMVKKSADCLPIF